MICCSLNLLFFIVLLLFLRSRTLPLSRPAFLGQVKRPLQAFKWR
jgi:hypothetical protein